MNETISKRESTASDSIRLPVTLLDSARTAGEVASRSIPKQLEYWARIGRLVAESPAVSALDLTNLIKSGLTFDEFTSAQKYVVLANAGAFFDGLDGDAEFGKVLARQGMPLAGGADGRVTWTKPPIVDRMVGGGKASTTKTIVEGMKSRGFAVAAAGRAMGKNALVGAVRAGSSLAANKRKRPVKKK